MSLRNMNIAPRALLGFALIGLLMLGLGIFSLVQMGNIRQAGEVIEQDNVPSIKILDELTGLNLRMRTLSYRLLVNRDAQTQRDTLNLLDQRNAQMDRAREAYVPMIRADDEQAAFDQLSQYRQLESRMRTLSQENRLDELSDMLNRDLMANSEQMNKVMDTLLPGAALRPIATQGRSYK
ncbi:MCP four helix bundle domain-containing protein, partial [Pseudomonas juntendi]